MSIKPFSIAALIAATSALGLSAPVAADTLQSALISAYASNPDIAAARAGQQITSERLSQAVGAMRPTIGGRATLKQETSGPGKFDDRSRNVTVGITATQPVFRGGQLRNGVRAADKRVLAGRQQLRVTENQVMLDTVTVYRNVLRDQSEVRLTDSQVKVLKTQLQATSDRFEVGDLTRTDVAQSEARLATAQSQNILAKGRLATSRAAYVRVVGRLPVDLEPTPPLPPLPGTRQEAVNMALDSNPFLNSARLNEQAARYDVRRAEGARAPSLDATLSIGYTNLRGTVGAGGTLRSGGIDYTQNIGATLTVPIYQGGVVGSRIREAKARRSQLQHLMYRSERTAIENTGNAYSNLLTARAAAKAAHVAVQANTLALEGVRAENQVGSRTILDLLNAEQELLNSQVALVRAERDAYVAGYALLATIGRAEASALGLPVDLYKPRDYTRKANRKLLDWAPGFDAQPIATGAAQAVGTR